VSGEDIAYPRCLPCGLPTS